MDKVEPALQAEPQEPSPGSGKCYESGEVSVTKSIDKEVDANNDSDQISENGDESDADLTKPIEKEVDVDDEAGMFSHFWMFLLYSVLAQ